MRHYLYYLTFPDSRRYIGHTSQPKRRLLDHRKPSRKTGNGVPAMIILCIGSREYIADLEGKAIIAFGTNDPASGLNVAVGKRLAAETKRKIGEARTGQKASPETRQKMKGRKAWNKGVERTPEERAAIKAGLDNSEKTAGAREKLAELNRSRAGSPLSDETRAKVSAAHKGKPKSPEQRARMSEARALWWQRRRAADSAE